MFKNITKKYIAIVVMILVVFVMPVFVFASTPSHLSYTGKLTDTGGNPLGGGGTTYYFKFSLWDSPTPGQGTKVWPTTSPNSVPLTVKQGSFSVLIGDTSNGYPDTLDYDFNSTNPVYLQVEVSTDDSTFETLAPRSTLSSNAFSQIASRVSGTQDSSFGTTTGFANTLVSMLSTAVNKAVLTIKGAAGQVANLFNILDSNNNSLFTVTADGKVGVGTSTPGAKVDILTGINTVGLNITGSLGQVSDYVNVKDNNGTTIFSLDKMGNITMQNPTQSTLTLALKNTIGEAGTDESLVEVWGQNRAMFIGKNNAGTQLFNMGHNSNLGGVAVIGYGGGTSIRMNSAHQTSIASGESDFVGRLTVKGVSAGTDIVSVFKGGISQTADLTQWRDASNNVLSVVAANGNFGIGTTAPTGGKLVVAGSGNTTLTIDNTTSGSAAICLDGNGGQCTGMDYTQLTVDTSGNFGINNQKSTGAVVLSTNNTERMRITSTGNVGIGTTATTKFHVLGDTTNSGGIAGLTTFGLSSSNASPVSNGFGWGLMGNLEAADGIMYGSGSFTNFWVDSGAAKTSGWSLSTRAGSAMTFVDAGLGLGTASPSKKLHIYGTDNSFRLTYPSVADWDTTVNSSGTFGFAPNNGSNVLSITAGGNVGLGTIAPGAKLNVIDTVEPLRFGYDESKYGSIKITNGGDLEFSVTGDEIDYHRNAGKTVYFDIGQGNTGVSNIRVFNNTTVSNMIKSNGDSYFNAGNVGIGTTTPTSKLSIVNGGVDVGSGVAAAPGVINAQMLNAFGDTGNTWTLAGKAYNGYLRTTGGTNIAIFGVHASSNSATGYLYAGYKGSSAANVFNIDMSGNGYFAGTSRFAGVTSGTYAFDLNLTSDGTLTTASSDERLKQNITPLNASTTIEKLLLLKPSEFDWISNNTHDIGLIAQEVEDIFPELVFTNPTDNYKGINYSRLPVLLLSAVQEIVRTVAGYAQEFRTEKLCVGDTCITESQLIELLEKQNIETNTQTIQTEDAEQEGSSNNPTSPSSSESTTNEQNNNEQTVESTTDESESINTNGSGDTAPSLSDNASTPEPTTQDSVDETSDSDPEPSSESDISNNSGGDSVSTE